MTGPVVTSRVQAVMAVAPETLEQRHPDLDWWEQREIIRAIIREAELSGWRVGRDSVHIRRQDPTSHTWGPVKFVGTWSPRGARMVGGEHNGAVVEPTRDDETGLPPYVVRLPGRRVAPFAHDDQTFPTEVQSHPAYRRVGIHATDDLWIYQEEGM